MMSHSFGMWGMPFMGMLLWIIILIIIVYVIVNLLKPDRFKKENETPLDILKKRFAKGEITKEEYEEYKKTLLDK